MQKAVQTVYCGPACPSAVVLPVRSGYHVRPLDDDDREWAKRLLEESWGSANIATRGRLVDASRIPGFVAVAGSGDRLGLLTYEVHSGECEIVTMNSLQRGVGIGQRLIRKVVEYAKEAGASRVWLITTNDNTDALRFYQKAGFRIVAVHRDAIALARRFKPEIPLIGENGIPIRDEIELELRASIPFVRGGRRRGIGRRWFMQALFGYGDNGEPLLGEVPVKAERSMDGLISHHHKRGCIHERVRLVRAATKKLEGHVKLVCCWMEHANPVT